jgi:hypothetical protein
MNELEQLKKENAELRNTIISIAKGLSDVKADAIMEVADNWIIRKDDDYNTRRKLVAISNKLRSES